MLMLAACATGARLILRFEPFILHAECRDLDTAMRLLVAARNGGYRESGATFGSAGARVMVRDWGTQIVALVCGFKSPSHLHRGSVSAPGHDVLFILLALQSRTHIL